MSLRLWIDPQTMGLRRNTMSARRVTIEQASLKLAELIGLADAGEDVVILRDNIPAARLVSLHKSNGPRRFGAYQGMIEVADDFDEPLPTDFWLGEAT
jgi:antitoxin (DNA-binding transcriptional repressor) of toxin-antitoxin stability system